MTLSAEYCLHQSNVKELLRPSSFGIVFRRKEAVTKYMGHALVSYMPSPSRACDEGTGAQLC